MSAQVDLFAAVAFNDSADTDLAAVGFNTANPLDHLTFSKHFQFRKNDRHGEEHWISHQGLVLSRHAIKKNLFKIDEWILNPTLSLFKRTWASCFITSGPFLHLLTP